MSGMIIGLAGTFGAGKGAVVEYLINQKGFTHYSASGYITEEITKRGLLVNRDSMIAVANQLRSEYGPTFIVDELYTRAHEQGGNAAIESLRAVAEVQRVKELGGVVLGVDAEPALRYERSVLRASEKDNVTFERWQEQEKEESNTEDPTKQNIYGALEQADHIILNNGTLAELHNQIDTFLDSLS